MKKENLKSNYDITKPEVRLKIYRIFKSAWAMDKKDRPVFDGDADTKFGLCWFMYSNEMTYNDKIINPTIHFPEMQKRRTYFSPLKNDWLWSNYGSGIEQRKQAIIDSVRELEEFFNEQLNNTNLIRFV